ncbi:SDR family oxidoreductase [Acidaminobacter sp. JC074]|uniref:SDR family NAD(P)-dependent oxidoreductase n=1 Tax=Acidaminobacter sp. JC074 TaxID=2530199 RepID=UPI001F11804E|nr:SDR family oxidoreductase [Acidaminobacter sp. JC074]MCH4889557.1 SDR family oxidoreductase [Acidaminobacter sp. JC074]
MKKTALITGASSGIGKELARIHAEKGGDLIVVARSEDKLLDLKKELESQYKISVTVIPKDLSKTSAAQEIYDEVKALGLKVDYLMNNAGFGGQGYFHERDWDKDLSMMNVNMFALTNLTRLFLPEFVKRNSGKILNTSSTAGEMPGPLQAVYYATKAYVTSFSNALSIELEDTNITVTALLPGATNTGFASTSGMDKTDLFRNMGTPDKVARDGYEAMLTGKMNVISGISPIMMNLMGMMPKKTLLRTIKKQQEVRG